MTKIIFLMYEKGKNSLKTLLFPQKALLLQSLLIYGLIAEITQLVE